MSTEMSRDYFIRQAGWGRRVIFEVDVAKAWPSSVDFMPLTVIEGMEFTSEEAAARFDVGERLQHVEDPFDSWDEAEAWMRASP